MKSCGKNRAMRTFLSVCGCVGGALLSSGPADAQQAEPAERILRSYVDDFRKDPAASEPFSFGVRVTGEGDGDWHVVVAGRTEGAEESAVTLKPGFPPRPTVYYTLDLKTLRALDRGEMNALTAMGKAQANDPAPMDVGIMPGFEPEPSFFARFIPFTFHFWTRGFPEKARFGAANSRIVHGANAVVLYYQKGLRSAWFQISKGQHINEDPQDQTNPFPSMFIMVRGTAEAKIGGQRSTLPAGEMMLVPADVSHEFWNPHDEPAEMIVLMFGEGA